MWPHRDGFPSYIGNWENVPRCMNVRDNFGERMLQDERGDVVGNRRGNTVRFSRDSKPPHRNTRVPTFFCPFVILLMCANLEILQLYKRSTFQSLPQDVKHSHVTQTARDDGLPYGTKIWGPPTEYQPNVGPDKTVNYIGMRFSIANRHNFSA
jgi:hypothetical protein